MKSTTSPMRPGRIPTSESPVPAPPSHLKHRTPPRPPKENLDPNHVASENASFRSGRPLSSSSAKNRSPLPPRPPLNPNSNPLKRKLNLDAVPENGTTPTAFPSDSGVQVILRMRPPCEEESEEDLIVQKISSDAVSVLDHTFTFDSVADTKSTQDDIFQLVGRPLVENCLAGFNSSIFAYGQTGSGKTYTMWGPLSSISKDELSSNERGLTPRVFARLFDRIKEEQLKNSNKQLSYQCRCSFLEIYNEQITDLLEPVHGSLQIREDVRTGIYVENLTEALACSTKDVIQLLKKGLENRRTGATSINAESSRSHCVFTCILESRSKCMSDGLSSVRTSRINLVDLAGSERQKQTGAAGERLKEAGNINRSLSQLGNLINILAEVSQSGKQRHIPYRDSRLTFLLQESLGGNAKLAMICAISPSLSCKSESLSTLRFAQRAKAIRNKAVVNEVTQDDVNVLREQIRQLKDELLRMKSNGGSMGQNGNYSTGWNARRSLTILRQSLSHPMVVPAEDDNDEVMEIDDADIEKPFVQSNIDDIASCKESVDHVGITSNDKVLEEVPVSMDVCELEKISDRNQANKISFMSLESCQSENVIEGQLVSSTKMTKDVGITNSSEKTIRGSLNSDATLLNGGEQQEESISLNPDVPCNFPTDSLNTNTSSNLSIVPCQPEPVIELPTSSISPRTENCSRKSLRTSLLMSAPQEDLKTVKGDIPEASLRNYSLVPTEQLAKSLHRGLQIFDLHQHKVSLTRSSFMFLSKPGEIKPSLPVLKIDSGVQTLPLESQSVEPSLYICSYCKNKALPLLECNDADADAKLQLVPINSVSHQPENLTMQVPKAVEKVLAGSIRREMALEDICAKQVAEIAHLNRLVQQYKHERECNLAIEHAREGKVCRLEGLMDGIVPADHYMEDEFMSLTNEHKILQEKYENHPEVLRIKIELKRVLDELGEYKNFFDLGEKDVLMEEIHDLRCQLQYYVDSPVASRKRGSLLKLTYPSPNEHGDVDVNANLESIKESCTDKKLEEEGHLWTEMESKWISLAEDLRVELEVTRSLSEKQKLELDSEKKCLAELKEALRTAMEGHACILEQFADLQEKHVQLLARHRKIRDGITDVKKAAARAGVRGAESKFIDALAAELSALKAEREKERKYWKDENKELQAQLRDTAEAVQAAGELLVRLKESEEAAIISQKRIDDAEKEVEKCHREIDGLKKKHESEIAMLNQFLAESRLPKEALPQTIYNDDAANYDTVESLSDERWRDEFAPFNQGNESDFSRGAEHHSWFTDYDRCNI